MFMWRISYSRRLTQQHGGLFERRGFDHFLSEANVAKEAGFVGVDTPGLGVEPHFHLFLEISGEEFFEPLGFDGGCE